MAPFDLVVAETRAEVMRPSAYFLGRFLTFHSISAGGVFELRPKSTWYSTFSQSA